MPWIREEDFEIMRRGLEMSKKEVSCDEAFEGCQGQNLENLIDMTTLRYWQRLSRKIPLTINV